MGGWRRRLAAAVLGVALAGAPTLTAAGCEWPEGTRYVDKVFTDVDVTRDVVYRRTTTYDGWAVDLRLNVYEPRGDTRAERPVVMWMFGGSWAWGDRNQLEAYAVDSAQRGYVGVTIDYRIRFLNTSDLVGAALDAYDDAAAAVAWLKDHAAQYRLDPDAVVAGGVSAGAVNALNLAYIHDRGHPTSPIAGAISISGLAFVAARPGDPPAIMHHGTTDTIAPFAQAKRTCDDAVAVGDVCEWLPYQGGDHFIVFWYGPQIMETSAELVFERVLLPLGYEAEAVGVT
jgi:acetyl esterase/lipase